MATQRKPRNLNDLARQANVTAATVSMALRDSPQVSVQVREKIRQLAAEQGFTPRAYNRRPRTERPVRKQAHLGPVALLLSQEGSGNNPLWGIREDPILGPVLPVILERFNRYGIDYACLAPTEAKENPALLNAYNGVLYHNDLKGWTLPEQDLEVTVKASSLTLEKTADKAQAVVRALRAAKGTGEATPDGIVRALRLLGAYFGRQVGAELPALAEYLRLVRGQGETA